MDRRTLHTALAAVLLTLLAPPLVRAQEQPHYPQPFDFPVAFAGNFGELRSNHFHAGLDFKTQGAVGKPVRAQADGYISRIRVNTGSGYVLNVMHGDGHELIYRHLSRFTPDIDRRVKEQQYANERWEGIDIVPAPDEYPVAAGQTIAYSGNTGYSMGPHLHLDVVETATDEFIDPLPFFAAAVSDHTPPTAEGIMVFPQTGQGVVDGQTEARAYPAKPQRAITAWGLIGVGLKAYDHMEGVSNRYGVKYVTLEVDSAVVFTSTVDRFAESENLYINSWTEGQYMKSFVEPGNRLRMLRAMNGQRGLVSIDEERPYRFRYTMTDGLGNTSHLSFTVTGRKSDIPEPHATHIFRWDRTNTLQEPGLDLIIPRGRLYDDVCLDYSVSGNPADLSSTYRITRRRVFMHGDAELRIGVRRLPVADTTKYYIATVLPDGKLGSVGGKYSGGFVSTRIRRLGTFRVAVDTVAPAIVPVRPQSWRSAGRVQLRVTDGQTAVASFRGTIDGEYALFGNYNSASPVLTCVLDPDRVRRGTTHTLVFTATDQCGNTATETMTFTW